MAVSFLDSASSLFAFIARACILRILPSRAVTAAFRVAMRARSAATSASCLTASASTAFSAAATRACHTFGGVAFSCASFSSAAAPASVVRKEPSVFTAALCARIAAFSAAAFLFIAAACVALSAASFASCSRRASARRRVLAAPASFAVLRVRARCSRASRNER